MLYLNPVSSLLPYFLRLNLILSFHLHLGLPHSLFSADFPVSFLVCISPCCMFHLSHSPLITLVFYHRSKKYLLITQFITVLRVFRLDLWELNYAFYLHKWKANIFQSFSSFSMDTFYCSHQNTVFKISIVSLYYLQLLPHHKYFPFEGFLKVSKQKKSQTVTFSEQKGMLTHKTVLMKGQLHKACQVSTCTVTE